MKIIVFGSTGMLGKYCVKYFRQKGYAVLPVDREMLDLTSSHEIILHFLTSNVFREFIKQLYIFFPPYLKVVFMSVAKKVYPNPFSDLKTFIFWLFEL